eukprot:gene3616-4548_t
MGGSIADETDFWSKYFPSDNTVKWDDFAVYLLMEYAQSINNLTSTLSPALGGHFDIDNDGIVSRKEYNKFLRTYGELGLQHGLQQAVDSALDNNWRRDAADRRRRDSRGCALEINSGDGTHVALEASADLQFAGAKPFFIEMWIRPRSGENFGGTIFSKYNRGRKGQYFISLETNGGIFFHREVAPWGLRSNARIPPDVFSHVAVGYGGGRSKIYINGTLRGSQREGAQAADTDTGVLIGAIHDQDQPSSIFDGTIDEVRVWGVDRTQVELESTMYTTLTGLEYGLVGYWNLDECQVAIRTNQEIVQCPEKGKCSIDEVNKKIIRELLMTVDTLTNRIKWLESQDRIRHEQVLELNSRNINISSTLGVIRNNFTAHLVEQEQLDQQANQTAAKESEMKDLLEQLAGLADEVDSPLPSGKSSSKTGNSKK